MKIYVLIFLLSTISTNIYGLDSLLPQSVELDRNFPRIVESDKFINHQPRQHVYPPRRHFKKIYEEVVINDPQEKSAGFYIRVSQKGADYLTSLLSKALPQLLESLVLPTIEVSNFIGKNFVITKFSEPFVKTKFIDNFGVNINLHIPYVKVEGDCTIDLIFSEASSHMEATINNFTIEMDVNIERKIGDNSNKINVTKCDGNVPVNIQFFGGEADSLNSFKDLIASTVEDNIKEKLCILPSLLNEFMEKQQEEILSEKFWNETHIAEETGVIGPKIEDHLCSDLFGPVVKEAYEEPQSTDYDDHGALEEFGNDLRDIGTWAPDLTLRFPLTFSDKDVIFGIDGGIVLNGIPANIDRPKLPNVTVIRDQMAGLIINEYVPNAFLYHVFEKSLGSFVETFNLRHVPRSLRPFAKVVCSDCMVMLKANLTQRPHVAVSNNGIILVLEGDVGAHFYRKNKTHELLSADGVIRVVLKPTFRHSRIYSDVQLTGVDFKVYKVGVNGLFASSARKLLNFIIPRTIWPRVQKSLRFAINRRGIKLPTFCGVQFEKLHVDYIKHAAILSADFNVDLPFFVKSFKQFLEADLMHSDDINEYHYKFRYL